MTPPAPMSGSLPAGVRRAVLLRSFLVQGSWNYRTMQGNGMAWVLLPALRHHFRDAGALEEALERHAEHFNGHPYLDGLALGALARMEADGVPPENVRRFRSALRGPLGALGDRVIWATWLPLAALAGLLLYWIGLPGWLAALVFLGIYNALHLVVRIRGFDLGYEAGMEVGPRLRGLDLAARAERTGGAVLALVGVVAGVLATSGQGGGGLPGPWFLGCVGGFLAGLGVGVRLWKPAAVLTVAVVGLLFVLGSTSFLPG